MLWFKQGILQKVMGIKMLVSFNVEYHNMITSLFSSEPLLHFSLNVYTLLSHTPCQEKAMSLMAVGVVQIKHNRVVGNKW